MRRLPLALLLAACSSDAPPPPGPPVGPVASFALPATPASVPLPSDFLRGPDGRLALPTVPLQEGASGRAALLAGELSALDGWGLSTGVFFPVDGAIDPASLTADSAVLVDLESGARLPAQRAFVGGRVALWPPRGQPLAEGHRYGAFLTAAVRDPAGHALRAATGFAAAWSGDPVLGPLRALGATGSEVVVATVFTTGHPAAGLLALREAIVTAPPRPASLIAVHKADLDGYLGTSSSGRPGIGDPGGVAHDAIALVVDGRFPAPSFLSSPPGHLGIIGFDGAGKAVIRSTDQVPFLLALPQGVPYDRLPVVIFQHGIDSSRSEIFAVANTLARAGIATIGIDALYHGSRAPGAVDQKNNLTGAAMPDGVGDPSAISSLWLFAVNGEGSIVSLDLGAVRDNLRQAAADLVALADLLTRGDWAAIRAADPALQSLGFDTDHLVIAGHSMGTLISDLACAVEPSLGALAVSASGGALATEAIASSPRFAPLFEPLISGTYDRSVKLGDPSAPPPAQLGAALIQTLLEGGDPIAFGARLGERHRLFVQAYADEVLPNQANDALARAAGATQVLLAGGMRPLGYVDGVAQRAPPLAGNGAGGKTAAVVQLDPATHEVMVGQTGHRTMQPPFPPFVPLPQPETIENPIESAQGLLAHFAASYAQTGVPEVAPAP